VEKDTLAELQRAGK